MTQLSQSAAYSRLDTQANHDLEVLLDYMKQSRGFDFTGYKRSSVMRRVLKRMQNVEIDSYRDYINYLELHPQEFTHLLNTLLINFTSFFRDRSVWDYLTKEIVPSIILGKAANEPIRVWSAGCASGEEAYTLAIVLAEALGVEQFRQRVKIYATDIDEEALIHAIRATYNTREVTNISPTLLEKYFERTAQSYIFRQALRCSLVFGCHNLLEDARISRVDMLTCRNVLIYFNTETQKGILSRFYNALHDSGFLVLGQAERVRKNIPTFTPVDLKQRIYTKMPSELI